MVDIKAALLKARGATRTATPRGRAIVEVHSLDEAAKTATGKIVDGTAKGDIITFAIKGHLSVADYLNKAKYKIEMPDGEKPGGTLQVEGLEKKDNSDVFNTRWIKTFQSKPQSDDQTAHFGEVFKLNMLNRKDANNVQVVNVISLDMANETHVTDVEALKTAMIAAMDAKGAVTIMGVTPDGDPIEQTYYTKAVKDEAGVYQRQPGAERFAQMEADLKAGAGVELIDVFGPLLEKSGVSVVATSSTRIGSDTWGAVEQKIDDGERGGPVDPAMFVFTGAAGRFAYAVNRLESEADRDAVKAAFLGQANEDAKAKYHAKGFNGVDDRDIVSFLEAREVKLIETPTTGRGYVGGAFLTQPFNPSNPDSGIMVTKAFNTTAATPFPSVKAFADLRRSYYDEMTVAAKQIAAVELGAKGPAVEEAPKAETKAEEKPAAEAPAAAAATPAADELDDAAGIDALLGSIGDDDFNP